jgi:hypothetical protein
MGVSGQYISPGFRRETGFLTQSGLGWADAWLDHTFTPGGAIDTWQPEVSVYALEELDGDHYRRADHSQEFLVDGVQSFWVGGGVDERTQSGASVVGGSGEAGWFGQVGAVLEGGPSGSVSRSLDFGTLGPAFTAEGSVDLTVRTAGLRVDLSAGASRHVPEGLAPETARQLRATTSWQWTRTLGTRLLLQESRRDQTEGAEHALIVSPLVTWLDVPGTAAYIGWTEQVDLLDGSTTQRAAFAKVSVLFRP